MCTRRPVYTTIANFVRDDVSLSNRQKVGEVASVAQKIVLIKDERFSYPSGANATKSDRKVNAIHYKPTPDHLKEMAKHEVMERKDKETLNKNWRGDVLLPAKFKGHRLAFLEMLEEF